MLVKFYVQVKQLNVMSVNASSVSKLIKPLNVSKTVCSNNTTGLNVCKVSSVSQLVKPSTVSKPVNLISVTSAVLVNSSKHLMLLSLLFQ